jgi:hypothetical protein
MCPPGIEIGLLEQDKVCPVSALPAKRRTFSFTKRSTSRGNRNTDIMIDAAVRRSILHQDPRYFSLSPQLDSRSPLQISGDRRDS